MQLKYDDTLDIAIGNHRKTKSWRNQEITWSALVTKLSKTHRTAETLKEYVAAPKDRQDEIKDIGGFVGGYLTQGRRKQGSVAHRQLITLDIDFGKKGAWEDFCLMYTCAAAMYTTHKHTAQVPRIRIVIPLNRPILADEYEPIARKIAADIDIEQFDPTTYQAFRLMYWPSTSKDGEFVFDYQDGEWLDADKVLATYHDWRDSSEWPISQKENTVIKQACKKQGDPLEKPGIVGAFCRSYSISEVIDEYLSEAYTACDVESRYSFIGGSTSGGLVVYEDKYAYSHHGTDPISGKLCNAFDLVRIHLFGLQDEDSKDGVAINKLPSYSAMMALATKDAKVRQLIGEERFDRAKEDFMDFDDDDILGDEPNDEEEDNEWLSELEVDTKGCYLSSAHNITTVLENDPNLKDKFALNLFDHREVALGHLPWRKIKGNEPLVDVDDAGLRVYFEKVYGISSKDKLKDGFAMHLLKHGFHPIKDYLNGLKWDGENRLDTLLVDYFGAEDTAYTRAVIRKSLIAAVRRVFKPGTKFDYVLVLAGEEGRYKSTFLQKLAKSWFSSSITTLHGKDAMEQLQGAWIIEIAELAGFKKAEVETIKNFISTSTDRFRVAYGRRVEEFPRQCIFFGTTNRADFLRAAEGNRRFWAVDILHTEPKKSVIDDLTDYEIDQIWAEAFIAHKSGEQLHLTKEVEALARQVQKAHTEQDARLGVVEKYLNTMLPANWDELGIYDRRAYIKEKDEPDSMFTEGIIVRDKVCAMEIYCEALDGMQSQIKIYDVKDIHNMLKSIEGWEEIGRQRNKRYGLQITFKRTKVDERKTDRTKASKFSAN